MAPGAMAIGFHLVAHAGDGPATTDLDRVLRHLGRTPEWLTGRRAERGTSA